MLNDYQGKFPSQKQFYLGLEPLCELHGDVHVGQAERHVVHGVVVHSSRDLVTYHVLPAVLLRQRHRARPRTRLASGRGPETDTQTWTRVFNTETRVNKIRNH